MLMIKLNKNYAKIDTLNTTLLLAYGQKKVFKVYYGEKFKDIVYFFNDN